MNDSHPSSPDINHLVTSAFSVLEQSPPPSLREILVAYRSKGDGDRDMLLAMLNAKSAEDQRLASVAALHRSVLEVYHGHPTRNASPPPPPDMKSSHHYPTPSSTYTQSPQPGPENPRRAHHQQHYPHPESTNRSPPLHYQYSHLPSMRDAPYSEPPRKRYRSSHSPTSSHAFHASQHDHLPPSPYSSSERSDSGDYSPRSRGSMAIGSLLSSRPSRALNGDES